MPALIGVPCVLMLGILIILALKFEECSSALVLLVACATLCVAAVLVVLAFARYQFSHLWKHPDPAFSKKAEKRRANGVL